MITQGKGPPAGIIAACSMKVSRVCSVTKTEEYRQNAAKCREVARTASPIHRQQLEEIAETWERLEKARQHRLELLKSRLKEAHTI